MIYLLFLRFVLRDSSVVIEYVDFRQVPSIVVSIGCISSLFLGDQFVVLSFTN